MPASILLIDPEPPIQRQVRAACQQLEVRLLVAERLEDAFPLMDEQEPDVVLLDVDRPGSGRFKGFETLLKRQPRLCCILIADRRRSEQAIEAMKRGAIDYLLKPLNHEILVDRLDDALRISRDMTVPAVYEAQPRDRTVDRIIGQSPVMQEVFKLVGLVAPRNVNLLITGESGTGKELIAKAIYHHSRRKDKPFLAVNCAAIPETLLESELFGHEKGAFTGAHVRRIGKFEQCEGGTLFLDEVGDIPLTTQTKLLRVLQDGSFQRLGGTETIHCDVRIIAATNQQIEKLIDERRFRQDLYYRLNVTTIHVPPLRERDLDPVLLAHYFVQKYNPILGTQLQRFAPEVLPILLNYSWPGNVRELENVMKASLVMARGNVFRPEFLPEKIRSMGMGEAKKSGNSVPAREPIFPVGDLGEICRQFLANKHFHGQIYKQAIHSAEREIIRAALQHTGGRLAPAARILGITRTTLRKKMELLGVEVSTAVIDREASAHNG